MQTKHCIAVSQRIFRISLSVAQNFFKCIEDKAKDFRDVAVQSCCNVKRCILDLLCCLNISKPACSKLRGRKVSHGRKSLASLKNHEVR